MHFCLGWPIQETTCNGTAAVTKAVIVVAAVVAVAATAESMATTVALAAVAAALGWRQW